MQRLVLALLFCASWGVAPLRATSAEPDAEIARDEIVGVGFAAVSQDERIPYTVRQLTAIRAAKVDAYRSLLEQAGTVSVSSASNIPASGAPLADSVAISAQGTLAGVEFVRIEPADKGIYKAVAVFRPTIAR